MQNQIKIRGIIDWDIDSVNSISLESKNTIHLSVLWITCCDKKNDKLIHCCACVSEWKRAVQEHDVDLSYLMQLIRLRVFPSKNVCIWSSSEDDDDDDDGRFVMVVHVHSVIEFEPCNGSYNRE